MLFPLSLYSPAHYTSNAKGNRYLFFCDKKLPNDTINIIGSSSPTHSFSLYTCLSYLTTTFIFCAHPFDAYTYIEQDPFPFAVILPLLDTTATLLSDVAYRNFDI